MNKYFIRSLSSKKLGEFISETEDQATQQLLLNELYRRSRKKYKG